MDFERAHWDITQLRRQNRRLGLALGALAFGHVLALLAIFGLLGSERTVVVPPTVHTSFWVEGGTASRTYLEQMGAFVAWLVLDVTPATIGWKTDVLLEYVAPDQYGALKTQQALEAARLKRLNASTYFLPQQLVADEAQQAIVIRGRLRTQVNAVETSNVPKAYRIEFRYEGGRLQLAGFREVPYDGASS